MQFDRSLFCHSSDVVDDNPQPGGLGPGLPETLLLKWWEEPELVAFNGIFVNGE